MIRAVGNVGGRDRLDFIELKLPCDFFDQVRRHGPQVRHESTRQPTPTTSPALYLVTAEPTDVTRPTIS